VREFERPSGREKFKVPSFEPGVPVAVFVGFDEVTQACEGTAATVPSEGGGV
jgi:hypothetical protein